MRAFRILAAAAAVLTIGAAVPACAGTISGAGAQPAVATLAGPSPQAGVQYSFQIKYLNNEKTACGARLDYGDGHAPEMIAIQAPMAALTRDVLYTTPGARKATLAGSAFGGMVACLGSASASASIAAPIGQAAAGLNLGAGTLQPVGGQTAPPGQPLGEGPKLDGPAGASIGPTAALGTAPNAATVYLALDAPVFPFGVRQGFKLVNNTYGQLCHFSVDVYAGQAVPGKQVYSQKFAATLPWSSPDLKLPPLPGGAPYLLRVAAIEAALGGYTGMNYCQSTSGDQFAVEAQLGVLSGINLSAPVVATGQQAGFAVLGKNYGDCSYAFVVGPRDRPRPVGTTVNQLPYTYTTSFPAAGNFFASADEIDDAKGHPAGCTGQIASATLTVIDRPACPSPQYAYANADDSEYGCRYPATVQYSAPQTLACPTRYSPFHTQGGGQVTYGCRQGAATVEAGFAPPGSADSGSPAPANSGPAKPTLQKIQLVAVSGGATPRPNNNVVYAGEALRLDISGNLPNNAGYGNQCGYTVVLENSATHVGKSYDFDTFDIHAFGAAPIAGAYSVKASPHPHGNVPGCLGEASANITLYPQAAWLSGLKLTGFGYHFAMGDAGLYPQFCSNCSANFLSPAHNDGFLRTLPIVTDGPKCAYTITEQGHDSIAMYVGGNVIPAGKADYEPFMAKWGSKNTATVTIKGFAGLPPMPACNGSVTRTITWTDDPSLPPVVVQ